VNGELERMWKEGVVAYFKVLSRYLLGVTVGAEDYTKIILPVISCGCETWSVTPRKEHKSRIRCLRTGC
jgi:hypothetical protein